MSEFIKTSVDERGIATLLIDRNDRRNAMSFAMLNSFINRIAELGDDPAVHVVVVTGGDQGSFCAGTDLSDLDSIPGKDRGLRGTAQESNKWWPLLKCPKPVIGAIDGPAVGMGAEYTSQCDIRIATTRARFAWNFVHRGLVPDTGAGTWLLPRLVGPQKALQLLYSGDFLSAEEAYAIGYVSQLVAPENLLAAAYAEAEKYLRGSPFALTRIKALVYEGLERDAADHMAAHTAALKECFGSNDHHEGVRSFLEKRTPRFTGT
ncbi:enoyl-CoA hydratase/isomerase family protein [Emcibacter sp. SYSU 3D8]|uniref:enoyl-CoA hydratase/isomerase family protein n=1 Tax=Emcibacter sp. SYSU 3D8 TaxID=3133969 RepID=UPI0031FEB4FD